MGNAEVKKEMLSLPGRRARLLAALAHASIITYLAGMVTGPLWPCLTFPFIPMIILAIYRKKDRWVSLHAWQAILYQLILFSVFIFIGVPVFIFVFSKCAPGFGQITSGCSDVFLPFTLLAVLALFILPLGMLVFGFVRGMLILAGKDVEYPLISRLVRKWLKPEPS